MSHFKSYENKVLDEALNALEALAVGGGISGSGTAGKLVKFTGATAVGDSIVIESAGKIGIGVSPAGAAPLQVQGDVDITGQYKINGVAIGGGGSPAGANGDVQFNTGGAFDASANLNFDGTNLSLGGNLVMSVTQGADSFVMSSGTHDLKITIGASDVHIRPTTGANLNIGTDGGTYLTVATGGNVGIGQVAPVEVLHATRATGNCNIKLEATDGSSPATTIYSLGAPTWAVGAGRSTWGYFDLAYDVSATASRLRVDGGGVFELNNKLGVNCVPSCALDVAGAYLRARGDGSNNPPTAGEGVEIAHDGTAGYIFCREWPGPTMQELGIYASIITLNPSGAGVGINITPTEALHVSGNVKATGAFIGDVNSGSGSVVANIVNATGFFQANGTSGESSGTIQGLDGNAYTISLGIITAVATAGAGTGIKIKEGSNARMGQATLVAGTVTIANTSITANTRIFYSVQTPGGTQGFLSTARNVGTDFTINSTSGTETSIVDWMLVEPA